ncbi:MAG: phosphomannomutase/phosphoglucomutase [Smithellaceae bacterium]|nr:phosphomannomutase/phosphoglucomutase [Smithellaceae bacterium]
MNKEVFREYDIRGEVDRDFNEEFVYDLGRAIGTLARSRSVTSMTIGRDCRLSSEIYQESIKKGVLATGIDVIDIGLCATPLLYFSIRHLNTGGGIMVTASHNPPQFNGFKICIGPDTIYGEDIQELRRIMEANNYASGEGRSHQDNVAQAYEDRLFHNVRIDHPVRIAFDGGNGVGGLFLLPLLKRLGCPVYDIYSDPDGRFPNHFPDPTVEENLQDLIRLIDTTGAEVGVSFDGDADRIGVVTDDKRILWGDELLILFARFILKENPGAAIIGEVKCSQTLFDDIEKHGGRAIMWKAGHSLIKGKMKEEKALLAGEMSGHIFFADRYFGYDDAIYATIRLLEILSLTGRPLSDLLKDVPKTFSTPEIRLPCPDSIKFAVVDRVREHFRQTHMVIDIDGVRVIFPDGWGLLRASNTQPVLVMRFEASTQERLQEIKGQMEAVLERIIAES